MLNRFSSALVSPGWLMKGVPPVMSGKMTDCPLFAGPVTRLRPTWSWGRFTSGTNAFSASNRATVAVRT